MQLKTKPWRQSNRIPGAKWCPSIFPDLVSCSDFRSILPHSRMHSLCVQSHVLRASPSEDLYNGSEAVSVYLIMQFGWVCNLTWLDYNYPTNSRTAWSVIIYRILINRSEDLLHVFKLWLLRSNQREVIDIRIRMGMSAIYLCLGPTIDIPPASVGHTCSGNYHTVSNRS
jgi:hypothetical protein